VHKGIINAAGVAFTGHTEMLAERTATPRVVMMLCGGGLRVALATTHVALRDVPQRLDRAMLEETLRILVRDMAWRYAIERPRIGVAGLNPHAGESGYLGREEIEIIAPVIERLAAEGLDVQGPLPADTLFTPARLKAFDAVLTMYHDQGLPVLKYASFGCGINVTLGLPIVRTSVDHGTALDIAGSGRADPGSLLAALEAAAAMARNAQRRPRARVDAEASEARAVQSCCCPQRCPRGCGLPTDCPILGPERPWRSSNGTVRASASDRIFSSIRTSCGASWIASIRNRTTG
jgi:4-hydroxythreonine-4-phosphate dehydrogenase